MSWSIILAFGAMLGWGIGDFLIQKTIKKIGTVETLGSIALIGSILITPFVFKEIYTLTSSQLLTLTILGVANFACFFVHFKALKIGKLSVVEVILSIEMPLTIILGLIIFKEVLNLWQIIFIILLFLGIILISVDPKKLHKRDFLEKGSLLAVLSGCLIALVNFGSASQAKEISPLMAIWIPWFVCGLICLLCMRRRRLNSFIGSSRKNWRLVLIMIIVDLLAWTSYVFAVAKEELAITIAITESYVVIALILGVVVNKEKITKLQYFGAAIAVACSLLIGFISK